MDIYKLEEKDILKYSQNEKILKLEAGEKILFSCSMVKINKSERHQSRNFVLTSNRIMNVGNKVKRSINLKTVGGISLSLKSFEFVIHVSNDYDYRFLSEEYREIFVFYIVAAFNNCTGKELNIFMHPENTLIHCCTQESDRDKKRSKIPQSGGMECGYWNVNVKIANCFIDQKKGEEVIYIRDKGILCAQIKHFIPEMKISSGKFGCKYSNVYLSRCVLRSLNGRHFAIRTVKCPSEQDQNDFKRRLQQILGFQEGRQITIKQMDNMEEGVFDVDNKHRETDVQNEKDIFSVPLQFCFREGTDFYMVMSVMSHDLYQRLSVCHNFPENIARHYFVQVLCALQFYHKQLDSFYGETKPENILVDEKGMVFLSGYRSPSRMNDLSRETLEYIAPELLRGQSKSMASDYWSLGVLLYEMIVGVPPFYYDGSQEVTISLILANHLEFPKFIPISSEVKNLLELLLHSDPQKRIGVSNGIEEFKAHPWLSQVDWSLHMRKLAPNPEDADTFSLTNKKTRFDYTPLDPNEPTY